LLNVETKTDSKKNSRPNNPSSLTNLWMVIKIGTLNL
jgi:hypothetical protein